MLVVRLLGVQRGKASSFPSSASSSWPQRFERQRQVQVVGLPPKGVVHGRPAPARHCPVHAGLALALSLAVLLLLHVRLRHVPIVQAWLLELLEHALEVVVPGPTAAGLLHEVLMLQMVVVVLDRGAARRGRGRQQAARVVRPGG